MKRTLIAFLLAAVSCSSPAFAAPIPAGSANVPVDVTADNMVYSADSSTVVFHGKVEAVRGEFKMWSDELTLYLKNDKAGNAKKDAADAMDPGELDRIVAEKNVRFQNGTQNGTARKATYHAGSSTLVLEGDPILYDGDNSIRGSVIRYYVNENRSVVEGSPKQRVHAVFSNEKKAK